MRLRASPNFALALTMSGRAYLAKDVEPYQHFWVTARERVLFALFAARGGMTVGDAVDAALRIADARSGQEKALFEKSIAGMRAAGVLIGPHDDTSRYDANMAADYLRHRPLPRQIADHIIAVANVGHDTPVLDLAGGPGSLALEIARTSSAVSMIELSRGFVSAARREAKARGIRLDAIHDSANRLSSHDRTYQVVTVSQALHWLDDIRVCEGIERLLQRGGSFFVVHGALTLGPAHPLAYILGDKTALGNKSDDTLPQQAAKIERRLALLFEAFETCRTERIAPVALRYFRQRRPIGEGFARAFLSPEHIADVAPDAPAFWADLTSRCAIAPVDACIGTQEWAVLHLRRGGEREARDEAVVDVDWCGSDRG